MNETQMVIPEGWKQLDLNSLGGILMIVGAPDVGKSTFAHYLYTRLVFEGKRVAFLDGDPGQSVLGPPTTITIVLSRPGRNQYPPGGEVRRWFIGSVTPSGHMLPLLVGATRLVEAANELGVDVIIYDTSGLVDPGQGGTALKLAKIDLLRPEAVFAIQAGDELESLLIPLRRSRRSRVVDLSASPDARRRDVPTRQAYRADQFANYFRNARLLSINWANLPIFPGPRFAIDCLVSCDDAEGFVCELGVVQEIDRKMHMIRLLTPLISIDGVASIRLGDLTLDRSNFRDYRR